MNNTKKTNKNETPTEEQTVPEPIQVLTRFSREELDEMKNETGANADATAVACYVRKNLRKKA